MKDKSRLDKILETSFEIGVTFVAFIMGAVVIRYNLPPSRALVNGFIAAEAYIGALEETESGQAAGNEFRKEIREKGEKAIQNPEMFRSKAAYDGYTLISMGFLSSPILVDMDGKIVYRWNTPVEKVWGATSCSNMFRLSGFFADVTHLFPNGDLITQFADMGAPYGCGLIKVDKDSNILWVFDSFVHHDSAVTAKGEVYVLQRKTIADPIKGFEELPSPITADYILKLSPEGKEEKSISVMEAFKDTPYEAIMFHSGKGDGDDNYDFFHSNSIDVLKPEDAAKFPMFKAGQILVSIRAFSTIAVIDPDTKKVVWAYHGFWRYQHAVHFLPNGHILLLDNQGLIDKNGKKRSRVIELNPATLGVEWSYMGTEKEPFSTQKVGRLQRLPNGNTLINESQKGRIFEVTPKGEIAWSYKIHKASTERDDYSDATFNATRFSAEQLPFLKHAKQPPAPESKGESTPTSHKE